DALPICQYRFPLARSLFDLPSFEQSSNHVLSGIGGADMQKSLEVMDTALRVLADINSKRHPKAADIDRLRAYAGPQADGMGLDEFACEVIHKALKQRAAVDRARQSGFPLALRRLHLPWSYARSTLLF